MRTAVFWDFGGVILSSPFEAFNHYERRHGLPRDFIRRVNATNPDANAWARLERSEIDAAAFDQLFAHESASLGHPVRGSEVLALLKGDVRPAMVRALQRLRAAGLRQACLTNNVGGGNVEGGGGVDDAPTGSREAEIAAIMATFDVVIESSKVGCRKPEVRFYELACERLEVDPADVVFLDDLGVNLKPAAAMGMHTIKVTDPDEALTQLAVATGVALR